MVAHPVELTRFRGHLTLWGGGIHNAEIETAVPAAYGATPEIAAAFALTVHALWTPFTVAGLVGYWLPSSGRRP